MYSSGLTCRRIDAAHANGEVLSVANAGVSKGRISRHAAACLSLAPENNFIFASIPTMPKCHKQVLAKRNYIMLYYGL